jgi:carboxylesterase
MTAADRGALHGADPSPVRVDGKGPAVLALHGYGGTAFEVRLVVEVAEELGLAAYAPLLPGHGTHATDLARTRFPDWLGGAESALDSLLGGAGRAVVVGLSLGSLIAAHLAASRKEVCAIGMLANATRLFFPFPDLALRLVDRLGLADFSVPKVGSDIADAEARATHPGYGLQPIRGAVEVLRAGKRTEKLLPDVHVPAFIAHGAHDHVCPVANAERVARLLGSRDKTVLILPRSQHIVTRDLDRDVLRRELKAFLVALRDSLDHSPHGTLSTG